MCLCAVYGAVLRYTLKTDT